MSNQAIANANRKQVHPSKTPDAVEKRERDATELMLAGANYSEIGRAIGLHPSSARKMVLRIMADIAVEHKEKVEQLRELEVRRLDRLLMRVWSDAQGGNAQAQNTVLRIMERKAKLLGLDMPVQMEVASPGGGPLRVTEVVIQSVVAVKGE